MKLLMIVAMSAVLVSCSSSPFKKETSEANALFEHMSSGVKYSNGGFPSKYKESGIQGDKIVAIGKSLQPMDSSEEMCEAAAVSNAKFSIIDSAPTTFTSIVEKTLSNDLKVQQFSKKDISISKIKNLKGIVIKASEVLCLTRMEPSQGREKWKLMRECRAISRLPVHELKAAYDLTLSPSLEKKVSKSKVLSEL